MQKASWVNFFIKTKITTRKSVRKNQKGEIVLSNIHPGFVLILTAFAVLIFPKAYAKYVTLAGSLFTLFSAFMLSENAKLFYSFTDDMKLSLIKIDPVAKVFVIVFAVISVISAVYALSSDSSKQERAASLVYAGSGIAVVLSGDWISFIGFWELMAAASIYIVWAGGTKEARRSSFRYMVMHLFGGNMLLAGALIIVIKTGNLELLNLTGQSGAGYWLVLIGVMVNCAMPPFHTWVPDSYPEATPEGTLYMGSFTTKVAVYALIRFFAGTHWLITFAAVVSVWAACMALIENNLRRLLSYHIISQLGMMVAALACGGLTGEAAAALHAAFNILYKGVLLMGAGAIFYATGGITKITDMGGLAKKMPLTAACFLIASLSIAGFPFTNGFASKGLVMEALSESGNTFAYWLIMAAGVGTWLSITMKINYFAFIAKPEKEFECSKVPASRQLAMVLGAVLCIITGVMPELTYSVLSMDSSYLFSAHHIFEYIGLFIGASVPFVLLVKKMRPHEGINLDLDVFYRGVFASAVFGLSKEVNIFFANFEKVFDNFKASVWLLIRNPRKLFGFKDAQSDGEDDIRPLSEMVHVMVLFCIIALIAIMSFD